MSSSDPNVLEARLEQVQAEMRAVLARQDSAERRMEQGEDRIKRLEIVVFGSDEYNVSGIMKELAAITKIQAEMIKQRDSQAAQWQGAQVAARVLVVLLGANLLSQLPDLVGFISVLFGK